MASPCRIYSYIVAIEQWAFERLEELSPLLGASSLVGYLTRMAGPDNPLEEYFRNNKGRLIWKWVHYFEIYHRHFAPYRGREVTVVEFGVLHGGSLQMWKHYFGPRARVIGVDVNPECKKLEEEQVEIVIGDQADRSFLQSLGQSTGPIDVVLDDGGHQMVQQLATFEEMFPFVKAGGVYLTEDLLTSYWAEFGGGYRKPGTFIEFAKTLIDQLHGWHSRDPAEFAPTYYTRNLKGMHVYDGIIVFDKGNVDLPSTETSGERSIESSVP
jgi:hypothetical protein